MDTETLNAIQEALPQIQAAVAKLQKAAARKWSKSIKNNWNEIYSSVSESLGPTNIPQEKLALAIAVCCVGPADWGPPPDYVWTQLDRLMQEHVRKTVTPEKWRDMVVAYGVGWERVVSLGAGGWDDDWETAFYVVSEICHAAFHQVLRLLCALGYDRFNLTGQGRAEAESEILTIALCIVHNQPQQKPDNEKKPGNGLSHWKPAKTTLASFLEKATRGRIVKDRNGERRLQSGSLTKSEMFPFLRDNFGLQVDRVEFRVCQRCQKELLEQHAKLCHTHYHQSKKPRKKPGNPPDLRIEEMKGKGLYRSSRDSCPDCQTDFDAAATYTIERKSWILLSTVMQGDYEYYLRYRCNICHNLHLPTQYCRLAWHQNLPPARSQRPTYIWVHRPQGNILPFNPQNTGPIQPPPSQLTVSPAQMQSDPLEQFFVVIYRQAAQRNVLSPEQQRLWEIYQKAGQRQPLSPQESTELSRLFPVTTATLLAEIRAVANQAKIANAKFNALYREAESSSDLLDLAELLGEVIKRLDKLPLPAQAVVKG